MKHRDSIVEECVGAFQACFNHYSDHPLTDAKIVQLKNFTEELLPKEIPTSEWQQYADDLLPG